MTLYNKLMQATDGVGGNIRAHQQDQDREPSHKAYCHDCDCDFSDGHRCIVCDFEISEAGCIKRNGHCVDCWVDLQWSLKH